jgi:SAM-dependent methyltransferase
MTDNLYVQYGCGRVAPKGWLNYDASPSLKIQRTPLLGSVFKSLLPFQFDKQVRFGDIVKGLPLEPNSCAGIYASHILEHLALEDFRQALKNTYTLLKPNGIFRCVLPDLEQSARKYVASLDAKDGKASVKFLGHDTALGLTSRPKNVFQFIKSNYGNAAHLWMWDQYSYGCAPCLTLHSGQFFASVFSGSQLMCPGFRVWSVFHHVPHCVQGCNLFRLSHYFC